MKTIPNTSETFKRIKVEIFSAIERLSDQTTNDKVIDIYDNYTQEKENIIRLNLSTITLESKKQGKERYTCYITLYLHGSDIKSRADIILNFMEAGAANDALSNFGLSLIETTRSRDASRNLNRGNVEARSSFSFSVLYERPS